MWMDSIYSNKELERITKNIYHLFVNEKDSFKKNFEHSFDISPELTFGSKDSNDCIYELLNSYYRNEYYVKRAFTNKCLNTKNVLYEYPIEDNRADIVNINELTCYEIKTKYDNLIRLKKQVNSYAKVFKYIYVICSEDKIEKVLKSIPSFCGVITYFDRKNSSFKIIKKAKLSPYYDQACLLNCCNKTELKKCFNTCDINSILKLNSKRKIENNFREILINRIKKI